MIAGSHSTDRDALIARKQEVRRHLERAQRELERLRVQPSTWWVRRRISALEGQVERLMAEEHTLRLTIDRAG